ncbi:MAG: aminotransferase class V-fold PLP-dependent enzyme [Leptolyngbya sp. PLA3]|nr:MAG: aminotransferase class V-fold PLP-dependent enzyme [Cyanobacteria bacterium CYA]MCE7968544.1 aminotransferase class V-fold PLP-dependent enzyme [Leptolyngbya sp. PL-A3]
MDDEVHFGRPLYWPTMPEGVIYLDNAATSWPKPPQVAAAMCDFLLHKAGNPGRGGHTLARAASETIEQARRRLSRLVNADDEHRMVLTHGCTDAVNTAIHGIFRGSMCHTCVGRPHVVASAVEHNAVLRTLHSYEELGMLDLTIVSCGQDGLIDAEGFLAACTDRTLLACLSHASNVLGTIEPVEVIGPRLRERSPRALFLVDAAQTAGHVKVDVQAWCIDLLALAGHKGLLGPTGTGALYVGRRAFPDDLSLPHLFCERRGGTGAIAPGLEMPGTLPDALEAGTMNAVGFAGLIGALDALPTLDHQRERRHTARIVNALLSIDGVHLYGLTNCHRRTSSIAFNVGDLHARAVAGALDEHYGIAVRGGVHCAPLLHQIIGTGERGAVRVSPGPSNTEAEIETFLEAVDAIAARGL